MSLFDVPISQLKGIGDVRQKQFHKLSVHSVGDLLRFYPRSYNDWSDICPISEINNGEKYVVKATVCSAVNTSRISRGRLLSKVIVSDDSGTMELVFFNNRFISSMLKYGEQYCFKGKAVRSLSGLQMIAPQIHKISDFSRITPVYNLTSGLDNRVVVSAVSQAIDMLPDVIRDPLPNQILQDYNLCTLEYAIRNIHFPIDAQALEKARYRLVFEELLVLNIGLIMLKSHKKQHTAVKMPVDYTDEFVSSLPYDLTTAQKRAVVDCINDMKNKKSPMNRLVQGDVGSGKTAVAAAVCYNTVKNGYQAAFMAPTEILACQHFNNFKKMFQKFDVNVDLLVGSMSKSAKEQARSRLQNGETNIIIGTHALLAESTQFKNLGCAITDEQHRFGVEQRARLAQKGNLPHILVLSATPIPRTLGLIIYGDLDITCIDELPPGRKPVKTLLIDSSKRDRALGFIKKELDAGRQCYVVCPLVEDSELELESAQSYAAELMLNDFADYPVGILHGKMKPKDKDSVMRDFVENKISLLVSTTVIEVGVDVSNACVIMIENAERFGLSQLHQLRGRVGRGEYESYCILVSDNRSDDTQRRLSVMCRTNNGFEIADEDLKLRGPGDFFGNRQHGLPKLSIADLSDMDTLLRVRQATDQLLSISEDLSDDSLRGITAMVELLFSTVGESFFN